MQFTLPVAVDYGAMDSSLLRRFWESRSAGGSGGGSSGGRERAPPELADRCLIFYRGVTQVSEGRIELGKAVRYSQVWIEMGW